MDSKSPYAFYQQCMRHRKFSDHKVMSEEQFVLMSKDALEILLRHEKEKPNEGHFVTMSVDDIIVKFRLQNNTVNTYYFTKEEYEEIISKYDET